MGTSGLTVVATPIGNLADVSDRTREVLAEADVIAGEDTRRVRKLLSALGIPAGDRLVSVHEHNERSMIPRLLDEIEAGRHVAVVSDAGMPTISDPGQELVAACAGADIDVSVVPGPSAVVTALAGSGLPAARFVFEGFPPRKGKERKAWLEGLAEESRTIVVFESPARVRATLHDLAGSLGPERRAVVCRELTKLHEQFVRGRLGDLSSASFPERGEIVIVIEGAGRTESGVTDADLRAWLEEVLATGATVKQAAEDAVSALGVRRNRAYGEALAVSGKERPAGKNASETLGE